MKQKIYRELTGLTVKTLLLSLFDVAAVFGSFDHRRRYARAYDEYLDWRTRDYRRFATLLYRLKTAGIIEVYQKGKQKFVELTPSGRRKIAGYLFRDTPLPVPQIWDGKWRLVIFDIPENLKHVRNVIRDLFKRVGFYQLQKSVYVYPHDCIGIIRYLEEAFEINEYVQFIVAERVETEVDLIRHFHDRGIIRKLKKEHNSNN